MITELGRDELISLGARNRADYLVEQAGYTLGLAAADGTAITELLTEGYLKEVAAAQAAVNAARQDRALMAAEAKDSTTAQNRAAKDAKVWRRKVARRAQRARRMGKMMPDGLLAISSARSRKPATSLRSAGECCHPLSRTSGCRPSSRTGRLPRARPISSRPRAR